MGLSAGLLWLFGNQTIQHMSLFPAALRLWLGTTDMYLNDSIQSEIGLGSASVTLHSWKCPNKDLGSSRLTNTTLKNST